jgi:DNA-binding beta-propeller fold protein YncE
MQRESFALSILLIIILVSSNVCNISSQNINKSLAQLPIRSSLKTYNFARDWGRHGTGDGQFGQYNSPNGIAVDSHGNVYVTDYDNNRVQKFDTNGNFITKWGDGGTNNIQFDDPQGIAVDTHDNVYVTDYSLNRVQKFDSNGNCITKWGSEGSKDGQFDGPKGIAVDTHGNVYVTDEGNTRIELFVPTINSSDTNKNNI